MVGDFGFDKNAGRVQFLAENVTDTHKKLTLIEKISIFNVCEINKDDENEFSIESVLIILMLMTFQGINDQNYSKTQVSC